MKYFRYFMLISIIFSFIGCKNQSTVKLKNNTEEKKLKVEAIQNTTTSTSPVVSLPTKKEQREIVNKTIYLFFDDVAKKDFTNSYKATAQIFQDQFSLGQFSMNFRSFLKEDINFNFIKTTNPTFIKNSEITQQNGISILNLDGVYTTPNHDVVQFTLKYLYINNQWKVFDIGIDFQKNIHS